MRKVPMRTCVVTKEIKPKKELIRICATKDKQVSIDLTGKAPGRGAYIHLSEAVIIKAKQTKALDKKLEVVIPDQIYEDLLKLL